MTCSPTCSRTSTRNASGSRSPNCVTTPFTPRSPSRSAALRSRSTRAPPTPWPSPSASPPRSSPPRRSSRSRRSSSSTRSRTPRRSSTNSKTSSMKCLPRILPRETPRRTEWALRFCGALSGAGGEGHVEDPRDEVLEAHPGGLGGLGEEAGVGEAGDRVGLEDPGAIGGEDQVDSGEAFAAEGAAGGLGGLGDRGALGGGEVRRADEVGAADLVARLEVVGVAFGRDRLDDRQRLGAEDADGELAALDEALEHHPVVVGEGGDEGAGDLARGARELDPERGAAAAWLDHQREAEAALEVAERVGGAEVAEGGLGEGEGVGGGDAGAAHRGLRQHLVDRARAGGRVGAGEGDVQQLEQLLPGPVLAADAVHRDEGDLGPLGTEAFHEVGADVDRDDLMAEPFERVLDPGAGAERDAALERAPAFEDRDAHQASPARLNG